MNVSLWIGIACAAAAVGLSVLGTSLAKFSRGVLEGLAAARKNPRAAARVAAIVSDVPGHVRALALPRMLFNLLTAATIIWWFHGLDIAGATAEGGTLWAFLLGACVSALVLWIGAVVLPMGIANHAAERVVYAGSPIIRAAYVVERPLSPIARLFDRAIRRFVGSHRVTHAEHLGADLRSAISEGEREGHLDETEREMIESVVEFRSTTVEQIMTPRTEIEAMQYTADMGQVVAVIRSVGHSRIPVFDGDLDHVIGIFYVKDLMKWLAGENGGARAGRAFDLKSILRPAIYVPETKTVRELLTELLQKKVHIAMVADEFGGTAGLVTMEDIIEEVFGDIQDEYEREPSAQSMVRVSLADHSAEIDARAYVHDANRALEPLGIAIPESDDYDTVGGFVITALGRIPQAGESFRHDGAVLTVAQAAPTRVLLVRLRLLTPADDASAEPPAAAGQVAMPETPVGRIARRTPGAI